MTFEELLHDVRMLQRENRTLEIRCQLLEQTLEAVINSAAKLLEENHFEFDADDDSDDKSADVFIFRKRKEIDPDDNDS